jgi:PAS domain S-box-containing protein
MNQPTLSEIRILVVDDNPEVLHSTARLLGKTGYTVMQATGGEEALAAVRQQRPDLLLMARDMPDTDGVEVCRQIKHDPALAAVFVIIVSEVSAASDEQAEGLEAGADGYIARPIANRELLARLAAYVRIFRLGCSLRVQAAELQASNASLEQARLAALELMKEAEVARERLETANQVLQHEIAERRQTEKIQAFLARTSSAPPDEPFFSALARFLAENLAMDVICVDRLEGDGLTARTEALWCDGGFEENVTYALKDTPCGNVVGKQVCCFPSGVCQHFPLDQVLQDLRAESYVGVTLFDHAGQPIGLIAVISRKPLDNRAVVEATLKLVAVRAAGEMERLRAEESLRETKDHLENLFNYANAPIVVWDAAGHITRFNHAIEELTGLPAADVLGHGLEFLLTDDQRARAMAIIDRASAGERFELVELAIRHLSGSQRTVLWNSAPIYDATGTTQVATIAQGQDITMHKQAEEALRESRAKLEAALASTTDAVFISDACGRLIEFNEAFAVFHRFNNKSECLKDLAEYPAIIDVFMADGELAPLEMWVVPRALRGETGTNVEYRLCRKDTGETWVGSYSFGPIRDASGSVVGSVVVGRDITERKRVENKARQSHDLLANLTRLVPGVVYQYQLFPDGRSAFPYSSHGMNDIYEVTPEEVREDATPVFGRLHPDDYDHVSDLIQESARTLRTFCCEFRVILPRQGLRWRWCQAQPERMEDGSTLWHGIISDITDRREAEKEQKVLRAAVEQSANTIMITDRSGIIEYVNAAFRKSTGYTTAETIGQTPRMLNSGAQDAEFYRLLWAAILRGEIWYGEFHNRRKDGSLYWESATISPVHDEKGEILHFIAIKEDITERKEMLAKLSEALNLAEAGNQAKSEFLAMMSHELRTPLNGVLGFAELLSYTPLNDEQKSYTETIQSSGNHLLSIVDDILDLSSIEKGTLIVQDEMLDIANLVKSSGQAIEKTAMLKGLSFRSVIDPAAPAQIRGDDLRIRQILINLLGNAVKFTSTGSVCLHVATAAESDGSVLIFSVEDTGIGISPETMRVLFQPFTQGDMKLNRTHGGTGLGLAISQRLAAAMGGKITVDSTPGKGSTFRFLLPLGKPAPSAPDAIPSNRRVQDPGNSARENGRSHTGELVLVVEDDSNNRTLAGNMLRSLGYQVEYAADGLDAVDAFSPGKYSAILMDVQMPLMNGLEATEKIRHLESGSHVRIIALTADVMPGNRERFLASGMDDFLSKPFKRDDLAGVLARTT